MIYISVEIKVHTKLSISRRVLHFLGTMNSPEPQTLELTDTIVEETHSLHADKQFHEQHQLQL